MRIFANQQLRRQLGKELGRAGQAKTKALQRLSSGKRLNRAADDPAGMAMGRTMEAMRRSLSQAHRNTMDGVGLGEAADKGIAHLSEITSKLRALALSASNEAIDHDTRQILARDYAALLTEYGRITQTVQWGGRSLLGSEAEQRTTIQVGVDGTVDARLDTDFRNVALRQVGRTSPTSGASLVSAQPLSTLTIPGDPLEATLNLNPGPFTFTDTVSLTGTNTDPINVTGEAAIDLAPGPYVIDDTVSRLSSVSGTFTVPPSTRFSATGSGFDVVTGENDTLRLDINGEAQVITFAEGFRTPAGLAQAINQSYPGLATLEDGGLVFQATGEVETVTVTGGSSRVALGLTPGQSSTARGSLLLTTHTETHRVTLAEGTYSTDDVVAAINDQAPGLASNVGGRVQLQTNGPQARLTVGNGSGNSVFGFSQGTSQAQDTFRFRTNYSSWREVVFPAGTYTPEQARDLINGASPGVASVQGERVRISSSSGNAEVRIGTGPANSVFGVTTGQIDTGENLMWLHVNGQTRLRTLAPGSYTMGDIVDNYNAMFPGIASLDDAGRVHLETSGPRAQISTTIVPLNGLIGLPDSTTRVTNNQLKLRVDGGPQQIINFDSGDLSASDVAETINAVVPGLASATGGGLTLTRVGPGASLQIDNGVANSTLGLTSGQSVTTPVQGRDLEFTINGEPTSIHFDPGSYEAAEIRDRINAAQPGFASLLSDGRLRLATQSVGNVNTVVMGDGSLNSLLGFTAGDSATGVDNDSLALSHLNTLDAARDAIGRATAAIDDLNTARSKVGAFLTATASSAEQLIDRIVTEAEASQRIMDADVAREMSALIKAELITASSENLLQAVRTLDRSTEEVLQLIKPKTKLIQ